MSGNGPKLREEHRDKYAELTSKKEVVSSLGGALRAEDPPENEQMKE